jgi:hypothetical protein
LPTRRDKRQDAYRVDATSCHGLRGLILLGMNQRGDATTRRPEHEKIAIGCFVLNSNDASTPPLFLSPTGDSTKSTRDNRCKRGPANHIHHKVIAFGGEQNHVASCIQELARIFVLIETNWFLRVQNNLYLLRSARTGHPFYRYRLMHSEQGNHAMPLSCT